MNSVFTTKMKCAVVSTLITLVFVSQAFAVLRPLFPIKPAAPFNGELIVIGDDLVLGPQKSPGNRSNIIGLESASGMSKPRPVW